MSYWLQCHWHGQRPHRSYVIGSLVDIAVIVTMLSIYNHASGGASKCRDGLTGGDRLDITPCILHWFFWAARPVLLELD